MSFSGLVVVVGVVVVVTAASASASASAAVWLLTVPAIVAIEKDWYCAECARPVTLDINNAYL